MAEGYPFLSYSIIEELGFERKILRSFAPNAFFPWEMIFSKRLLKEQKEKEASSSF